MTPLDGSIHGRPSAGAQAAVGAFFHDVIDGLAAVPKRLAPKYFYDRAGSLLFDAICDLPEYYITRTELAILDAHAGAMADRLGSAVRLVEPGAGSGTKTRLLLEALGARRCVEYVPVDISAEHLEAAADRIRAQLAWLAVAPHVGDFTVELPLPLPTPKASTARTVVYFPGSTIGNFDPPEAAALLTRFRRAAGEDGRVLLGVDLKKDPAILHAAYNDASGVTAAFNKNVLRRINAELGATFDVDAFHHYACYAPDEGRIEMHLVSARRQRVAVGGFVFSFDEGESICTEHSYKYDLPMVERLARSAGLALMDAWLDGARRFAVLLFRAP